MADPFDVEPPRWAVLPPVDMSGMKYVGQNLGRYAAAGTKAISEKKSYGDALAEVDDPFFQLKRARLSAELEEMKSKLALDKMGYMVKQRTLQQQTQSELDTARIFAETEGDPNKMLTYQYTGSNPYTIRTLAQMKLAASKDVTIQARQKQEIGWNSSLTKMAEHGDMESAKSAAEIFNSVRKNGWSDENIQAYTSAWGAHNVRNPKVDKLDSFQSLIAGSNEARARAKQFRDAGNEDEAKHWDEVFTLNQNRLNVLAPRPEAAAQKEAASLKVRAEADVAKAKTAEVSKVKDRLRKARNDLVKVQASWDAAKERDRVSTWTPALEGAKAAVANAQMDMDAIEGKPKADSSPAGTPAQSKAALANKLATENPNWSRQQIIDEVNKQMSQ